MEGDSSSRLAHRSSLLAEAVVLLGRVQQAGNTLALEAGVGQLESLMRDLHSYKSLIAFAGLDRVAQGVTAIEAYLGQLWRGRLPFDAAAVSQIGRMLAALSRLHAAGAGGADAEADAIVAELRSAPCAVGATVQASPPPPGHRPLPQARGLTTQVDAAKLAEVEALAGTAARLMRRLEEAGAFPKDQRVEMMRLALDGTLQRLQQEAHACRCCTLQDLFAPAAELVSEIASQYGRRLTVTVDVAALDIELSLAQVLRPAVMHIFRNAVAHGIELPEDRVAAGKPQAGLISVSAHPAGDRLVIVVRDDGRGFDLAALREEAVSIGAVSPERSAMLSDEDALRLALIPGLSTSDERTELSGSGMGLSSISEDLASLRGKVRIESEPGRGTAVVLELPLPPGS
jgi:two-component system, chemotaxis family, sensor kinase CheA